MNLLSANIARTDCVRDLPKEKRPRERLVREGPEKLSDRELLSILLNTGIKGKSVNVLAEELLDRLDRNNGIPSCKELTKIGGLGEFKAATIAAVLELGRRRWGVRELSLRSPEDVYNLIKHYADRRQERFLCISLNGAHEVLAIRVVTVGLVNKTIVHPREVFSDPLQDRASAICVAHNHPSGKLEPSGEDDDITSQLRDAADILGINFLDHIIFSTEGYYSYSKAALEKN
ncbi:MAG: DNA repair protein RadC [Treponema sp.]|nr:DNA repair protein RadC [Treponema sp.]